MALGLKKATETRKSCSCIPNEGRNVYCSEHGDQRYRNGQSVP